MGSRASLNHVYRTIWNQSLGAMVAVAEIVPSQACGSSPGSGHAAPLPTPQDVIARIGALALSIALVWGVTAPVVQANPTGAAAIVGSANLATQGNKLTVTTQNGVGLQHSAINWQSFSVPAGNTTHFQQPSAASTVINRVVTNVPTQLFGTLSSNGRLVLVNQAGIAVGAGALVDTAGFTASALRMTDADALAGRLRFGDATVSTAGVSVQGRILARSGDAVLIGSSIDVGQDALIQAPNGSTLLAAGQQVEITGRGLEGISFQLQAPSDQALNLGKLSGNAVGIFAGTLKHSGQIRADAVTVEGGKVVLKASRQLDVAGQVSAQALNQRGGTIQATAPEVQVQASAVLDASGAAGGGELLVGGGYQGKDARLSNAQNTTVEMGAQLRADATTQGDGGTVIVWADDTARVHGSVSARGGPQGGDGGFIETSGKRLLDVTQAADASAPLGKGGTWLLDPYDITIGSSGSGILSGSNPKTFTSFSPSSLISASTIMTALNAGTSVEISTGSGIGDVGNITVASQINKTSGVDATLTLTAHNDIKLNANISSTSSKLNLVMNADSDNSGDGGTVLGTASASLNGGAFTATSNGGRVRMSPTGAFNLNNAVASLGVLSFEPSTQLVANASGSFAVGSVNFNGGLLDIQPGGTDTATYNLNNYGTLRFSSFSTRTISGAINGDGTGTLETQLGKTLSGVNINTSLTQVGTLAFSGITTLGNGVTVSKGNSTWLFEAGASIATGGSATIANVGGSIYAAYNAAGGLTFGQGLTVRGYGAIRGDWASYAATLNNLGTIWSDTLGQTFTVNGNSLSNTGLLKATAGTMSLGPSSGVTNGGELLVNGGVMTVNVPVSGTGTATVQNGTMNLNAAASVQTMSLTGGTLGGSGSVSVTNSFTQTGGVINKTGSLSINQASGNLVLENIAAGSLTATANSHMTQTPGSSLVISGATSLAATGGDILLVEPGNDFNSVAFTSTKNSGGYGGAVSLVDSNSLVIAPIAPNPSIGESVSLAANQLSLAADASVSGGYIDVRTDALSLAAGSSLNAAGGSLLIQPRSDSRSMRIGNIDAVDPATVLYLPAAAIGTSIVAGSLTLGSGSSTYGGTTTVSGGLVNPAGPAGFALFLNGGSETSTGRLVVDSVTNAGRSVFLSAGTGGIAVSGLIDTRGQSVPDGSGSAGGSVTVGSNGNVALNAIKTSGGDGGNGGGGNAGNVYALAGGDISVSGPSAGIWANGGASSGNSGGGLAGGIELIAGQYSYGGSSGGDVTLSGATISNVGASNSGIPTLHVNARQGGGSSPTNGAVNIAGSTITTSSVTIYSASNLDITGSTLAATNGNIALRAGWDPTGNEGSGAAASPGGNVTLRSSSFSATANQEADVMIHAYGSSSTTGNVVIERNSATPLVGSSITADYLEIYAARDIDIRKGSVLTTRQFDLDLTAGSVNGHSSSGPGGYLTVEGATIDAGNTAYLAAISGTGINSSNGGAVTISQTTEPSPVRSLIRAGFIVGQADSHLSITNSDLALTTLCAGVCSGPLVDLTAGDKQTLGGNLDLTGSTIKGQMMGLTRLPVPGLVDLRANRTSLGAFGNVALGAIQADALSVSAGSNVTQSAALEITGATILAAGRQGYGGSVTLAHPGNSFGTVDVSAPYGGAISLVSSGAMTVNNLVNTPGHDVSLVASGALNLDFTFGVLDINTGNANLTLSSGSSLTTPRNLSGANVSLSGATGLTLAHDLTATGTLSLSAATSGGISQSGGVITVSGASTFTATGGDITLAQHSNDFGTVAATATRSNGLGGSVSLKDLNVLSLGNVTATNLTATAGSDLVQSVGTAITVSEVTSLSSGTGGYVGTVTLNQSGNNQPLNNFNTVAVSAAYGGAISLSDANALTISSLTTASGQLDQAISLVAGGELVLPTGNLNTGTADLTLSSGGTLTTPGNLSGGNIALTGTTGLTLAHGVAASGTLALNGDDVQVNSVVSSVGAMSVNASGSLQVLATNGPASLQAGGSQTIAANSMLLRGGASGSGRSALISSAGAQGITTTQGIALEAGVSGGGLGAGNSAFIMSDSNQSISAGSSGITLTGGGGSGADTDNFAFIYHTGTVLGSTQTLTLGGGGTLSLTGGSSALSSVGSTHGSFAMVQGDGIAQNISFTNGGGIALTGGTAGSRARAMVYAGGSASQTITGGPTVVLTGGSGNNGVTGEDNHAEIGTLNGSQSLTVASIALSGGVGGNMNRAAIYQGGEFGTQTVNVSAGGGINLQGGAAGDSNFAVIAAQGAGAQGTVQNISLAGGALSLTGGTVGTNNFAGLMSQNSGSQRIAGVTNLSLAGGASGGAAGLGNRAVITASGGAQNVTATTIALSGGASGIENVALLTAGSDGSQIQSITAGSISLISGLGGVSNGVAFRAPNQTIVTTGNLSMTGGGSTQGVWAGAEISGARIGAPGSPGESGAPHTSTPLDLTLTVGGSLLMTGGTVADSGVAIGNSGASTGAAKIAIEAAGNITMSPGSSGARIGSSSATPPGGDIAVSALGNLVVNSVVVNSNTTLRPIIGTSGNVNLQADSLTMGGRVRGSNVAMVGTNGLALAGNVTATGTLGLSAVTGGITQSTGAITATGATTLTAGGSVSLAQSGNNFSSVAVAAPNSAVAVRDTNAVVLSTTTANSLTVIAGGSINQSGSITASGASAFTAAGGDITLDNGSNDFGSVAATATVSGGNGGSVNLFDVNSLNLTGVTAGRNVSVTAQNNLILAAKVSAPSGSSGGTVHLTATSGAITKTRSPTDLDVEGKSIHLTAATGIGTSALPVTVWEDSGSGLTASLHFANTTSNGVFISSDQNLHVDEGSNTGGSITLASNADLVINGTLTASGSINLSAAGEMVVNADQSSSTTNLAVTANKFTLNFGTWRQVAATLPAFNVTDFRIAGGTFIRALGGDGDLGSPYRLTDVYGLQGVGSAGMLNKSYILANNIAASGTSAWNSGAGFVPIGYTPTAYDGSNSALNMSATPFTGSFDGGSRTVSNLVINQPTANFLGLFSAVGSESVVRNIGLIGANVQGNAVVGGLVGYNAGTVTSSYAEAGSVSGGRSGNNIFGGLVGYNRGTVSSSYATAAVTVGSGATAGAGLVGLNRGGTITNSFASGAVINGAGLTSEGTVTNSFWDTQTSGQPTGLSGTGLTTLQMKQLASFASWNTAITDTGGGGAVWRIYEGQTYPLLRSFLTPLDVSAGNGIHVYDGTTNFAGSLSYPPNTDLSAVLGTASFVLNSKDAGTRAVTPVGLYSNQLGYDIRAVSGLVVVTPKELTAIASAPNKVYDGTVTAAPALMITSGLVDTEKLAVTATGSFNGKDVLTASLVTVTGVTLANGDNGGLASNYVLAAGQTANASITPKTVTLSAAKVYDGTTDLSGKVSVVTGVVTGLGLETLNYTGALSSDAHVATQNKSISAITLTDGGSGGVAGNYQLPALGSATAAVTITPAQLTANAAIGGTLSKVYDGTTGTTANVTGSVSGAVAGDNLSLNTSAVSLAYNSKDVATASQIAVTSGNAALVIGSSSVGSQLSDYSYSAPDITPVVASISKAPLTVTGNSLSGTYNGATQSVAGYKATGLVNGEEALSVLTGVSASGASARNAGSYTNTVSGTDANYALSLVNGSLEIDRASLTLSTSNVAKTYDGTTSAVGTATVKSGQLFGTDTISGGSFAFTDKNAGTGKTVTTSAVSLSDGAQGNNYIVSYADNTASSISKAPLTVTGNSLSGTYNGATQSVAGYKATGLVNGEEALSVLTGVSASGASARNAGSYTNTVSGTDANYALSLVNGSLEIGKAALIVNYSGVNKTYDGSTTASVTTSDNRITNDDLSINRTAAFTDKNAGEAKTVNVSGVSLSGTDAQNYTVAAIGSTTANIDKAALTVSSTAVSKTYDGGLSAAGTAQVTAGTLFSGDTLTGGRFAFTDKNAGTNKTVTASAVTLNDGNGGLNYNLSYADNTASSIAQRGLSNWIAGTTGAWSNPANWDAIPDRANVLDVAIPAGVTVQFDSDAGVTQLRSLTSAGALNLTGGSLAVANSLSTPSYIQTGGALSGTGALTVSTSFSQSGGSIDLGGAVDITQLTGNLNVGAISAGSIRLAAQNGAISQTGALVTAGLLATQAAGSTVLTDAGNRVSALSANSTGDLVFTNTGLLDVRGLLSSLGNIVIDNTGGISSSGAVAAPSGAIALTANSPLTVGTAGVQALGDVNLTATDLTSAGNITLNGSIVSTSGSVIMAAANNLVQNSAISAALVVSGSAGLAGSGGAVSFGAGATTDAKSVSYLLNGLAVTAPSQLTKPVVVAPANFVTAFLEVFEKALSEPVEVAAPAAAAKSSTADTEPDGKGSAADAEGTGEKTTDAAKEKAKEKEKEKEKEKTEVVIGGNACTPG